MLHEIEGMKIDLSSQEIAYYEELQKTFTTASFKNLMTVNEHGNITSCTPDIEKGTPLVILYFVLNVMLNQRLRNIDSSISHAKNSPKKLLALEHSFESLNKRLQRLESDVRAINEKLK